MEKAALVRETCEPGMTVSLGARKHGVGIGELFNWRKLEREGAPAAASAGASVPASELGAARAHQPQAISPGGEEHRLLPKALKRRVSSRVHDGAAGMAEPNPRRCCEVPSSLAAMERS